MTNNEAIKTIKANYPDERYTMLREALDMAIEALEKQDAGWISVKDRLPEAQGEYLISDNFKVTIGWFSGENGWIGLDGSFYADSVVTYFMPLPEPPKEG
jgi:hypothetical protein